MRRWLRALLAASLTACAASIDSPSDVETRYWPNGKQHSRGQLINGLRDGRWLYWYQYGQKKQEGGFAAGRKHGTWRRWHPNGELLSISHYVGGVRQGRFESHYRDGSLHEAGDFVDGQRHGVWTEWLPGENGRREVRYEQGSEVSRRVSRAVDAPKPEP